MVVLVIVHVGVSARSADDVERGCTPRLSPHTVYSASKIAMSFLSLALEAEFGGPGGGVACNTLWPRYAVATAAISFIGGDRLAALSRTPAAVADAAFRIITAPASVMSGRHFIDDDILRAVGITDFRRYNVNPNVVEPVSDFFVSNDAPLPTYEASLRPRTREEGCLLPKWASLAAAATAQIDVEHCEERVSAKGSDENGGGDSTSRGAGGVVLLVLNVETHKGRQLCAAVAAQVLKAGNTLAVVAHCRQSAALKPTSSTKEAANNVADELCDAILSRAAPATEVRTETETETEDEVEVAASMKRNAMKRVFVQVVER